MVQAFVRCQEGRSAEQREQEPQHRDQRNPAEDHGEDDHRDFISKSLSHSFGNCPASGSCTGLPLTPTGYEPGLDYGTPIVIKAGGGGGNGERIAPGLYHPVVINPDEGPGGNNYRDNIMFCDDYVHTLATDPSDPPYTLEFEPGGMIGPTRQGIVALMGADSLASWVDPDGPGGIPGYPVNTCMETGSCLGLDGTFTGLSPRWIGMPLFNPDEYDFGRASGRQTVEIVNVVGLWLEGFCSEAGVSCPMGSSGNSVLGYMTHYPSLAVG